MNFEHFPEMFVAVIIALVLFALVSTVLVDQAIKTIEQKANNLTITCSDVPVINSSKIQYGEMVVYCALQEIQT